MPAQISRQATLATKKVAMMPVRGNYDHLLSSYSMRLATYHFGCQMLDSLPFLNYNTMFHQLSYGYSDINECLSEYLPL